MQHEKWQTNDKQRNLYRTKMSGLEVHDHKECMEWNRITMDGCCIGNVAGMLLNVIPCEQTAHWVAGRLVAGLRNNLMSVNRVVISDAWRTCQQIYSHATIVHERCTFRLELHRFDLFLQLVCIVYDQSKSPVHPQQIGNHSPRTLRSMRKLFFNNYDSKSNEWSWSLMTFNAVAVTLWHAMQ